MGKESVFKTSWQLLTCIMILAGLFFNLSSEVRADDRSEITFSQHTADLVDSTP